MIVDTRGRLVSLYSTVLQILAKVLVHVKDISVVSANKIIRHFGAFSSRKYLIANEQNWKNLAILFGAIDWTVSYRFKGIYALLEYYRVFHPSNATICILENPRLIYSILRAAVLFNNVIDLKFQAQDTERPDQQVPKNARKSSYIGPPHEGASSSQGSEGLHNSHHGSHIDLSEGNDGASTSNGTERRSEDWPRRSPPPMSATSLGFSGLPNQSFKPTDSWVSIHYTLKKSQY